jgi:hypothetical protein
VSPCDDDNPQHTKTDLQLASQHHWNTNDPASHTQSQTHDAAKPPDDYQSYLTAASGHLRKRHNIDVKQLHIQPGVQPNQLSILTIEPHSANSFNHHLNSVYNSDFPRSPTYGNIDCRTNISLLLKACLVAQESMMTSAASTHVLPSYKTSVCNVADKNGERRWGANDT